MNEAKKAKVIEAAQGVFFRYGYRRVTMGDIAGAAGMSRPALYLLFCNKEEIFEATLRAFTSRALGEVRTGLPAHPTVKEKLTFAFEVCAVQPFILLMASPDAKELLDCRFTFAKDTIHKSSAAFEAELAGILSPLMKLAPPQCPPPEQIARILAQATHGFKESATSVEDLRALIDGLLTLVLASFHLKEPQNEEPPARGPLRPMLFG
jgi:TetR/AcrR family transcriptional regulator, regulator of autoinduction and epiphytic fitness